MKRFNKFVVLCLLGAILFCTGFTSIQAIKAEGTNDLKDDSVETDRQAPLICIKNNEDTVYIVQGSEFKIKDYVTVSDNSKDFRLMSYGTLDTSILGTHQLNLIAIDKSGNTSSKTLYVVILTEAEMDEFIQNKEVQKEQQQKAQQEKEAIALSVQRDNFAQTAQEHGDVYEFAQSFLGMPGQCTDVAQAFVKSYFGSHVSIFDVYSIQASEAEPGDIIYYYNSGLGLQHYAVYLGGEVALHGNWEGTTKIKSIYLKHGTDPIFFRLNGK